MDPAEVRRGPPVAVFLKKSDFGPFLASGVVQMGPDRRYDSSGLCFGPNRRFSTHFGPNLMFLDLTELSPMWPILADMARRPPKSPDARLNGPVLVYD